MKFRTDFVTNSSSSSFSVTLSITAKNGKTYSITDNPYSYSPDEGGTADFTMSLQELRAIQADDLPSEVTAKKFTGQEEQNLETLHIGDPVEVSADSYTVAFHVNGKPIGSVSDWDLAHILTHGGLSYSAFVKYVIPARYTSLNAQPKVIIGFDVLREDRQILTVSSVRELCDILINAIEDDRFAWCPEEELEARMSEDSFTADKKEFIKDVVKGIKSPEDIAFIEVTRTHEGSGEGAILLADNDEKLVRLAHDVVESSGAKKKKALEKMYEYIQRPDPQSYGNLMSDITDFRYDWNGGNGPKLEELAQRLCSHYGPGDTYATEYKCLDCSTGKYEAYGKFDLH